MTTTRKIVGYKLLKTYKNISELNDQIFNLVESGWEPFGQPIITAEHVSVAGGGSSYSSARELKGDIIVVQPMVRYQ